MTEQHKITRQARWIDGKLWHDVSCVRCGQIVETASVIESYDKAVKHLEAPMI
jgi:hypothetical protein